MTALSLSAGRLDLDGTPSILLCSSVFPFRIPVDQWAHRLRRVRESGYGMVDLYVHWGFHEEVEGSIDLTSPERDLRRFLDLAAAEGLLVMARPGPYICSETDGGGLPWWLHGRGIAVRTMDPDYLEAVDRWYDAVMPVLAAAQTIRGGPVALVQIENELDFFDCPDPAAYQGRLAQRAREAGIEVPIIACAGQGDLHGASGDAEGVVPTVNLYPSDESTTFDAEARHYAAELSSRDLPLLVTETNRMHRTLRREILAGARLVAPYLQTSGFNHLLLPSAGNWGDPGNLMTHDYDFGGYLGPDGRRRPEYDEAVRLTRTLEAWGERLAAAVPVPLEQAGVQGVDAGGALALPGGGHVIGPAEVHGRDAEVRIRPAGGASRDAHALSARVPAGTCPFWALDVPLDPWGAPGTIRMASAELVAVHEGAGGALALHFEGPADARVLLETPEGTLDLAGHGEAESGTVRVALAPVPEGVADPEPARRTPALEVAALPEPTAAAGTVVAGEAFRSVPSTEELGLRDGRLRADLRLPAGTRELLLRGAADVIRLIADGEDRGVHVPHGAPVSLLPAPDLLSAPDASDAADALAAPVEPDEAPAPGEVSVIAETWGRANFDDARRPALALGAGRGIGTAHAVVDARDVTDTWRVRRLPDRRADGADQAQEPLRPLGGWSSPRLGEDAVYVRELPVQGHALLRLHGLDCPVHVSIDGGPERLLAPGDPVLELSGTSDAAPRAVEVAIRAPHVPDGFVHRAELLTALPPVVRALRLLPREELTALVGGERERTPAAFPLTVPAGGALQVRLRADRAPGAGVQLDLEGTDVQVTVVAGGRAVSRHVLGAPAVAGGDAGRSWIPASYLPSADPVVDLLVEPLDAGGGIFGGASWSDALS